MLTSSTLLEEDEASSLGTPVPPTGHRGENARTASVSDNDDDDNEEEEEEEHEEWLSRDSDEWRVVVTDGLDTHSLNGEHDVSSGLLILDGEEEEEKEENSVVATGKKGTNDNKSNNNTNSEWGSSLDFSVPGTDSVPTIVGSIDGLPAAAAVSTPIAKNVNDETKHRDKKSGSRENGTHGDPHEEDLVPFISSKSRFALLFVPTVVLFLVPTIASIRLYQERNSLLTSVSTLAGEIARLQEEAKKQEKEELRWNTCGDDSKDTVLVDNCWLTAKANIELGDCASHAKDNLLKLSASLSERLALLGHHSWIDPLASFDYESNENGSNDDEETTEKLLLKMENSLRKARDAQVARMKFLGEALWNATKGKTDGEGDPNDSRNNFSFFAKMESNGKSQWKNTLQDAKSAFKTIFPFAESATASSSNMSKDNKERNADDAIDDVVHGISDLFAAAGSLSVAAGEALVAAAVETAATAMEDFNQTTLNDIVEYTRQALDEASLARQADA